MRELGWLEDVPLCFLGYSFGAMLAYECARFLEHEWRVSVSHLVCLNGPDREKLRAWRFLSREGCTLSRYVEYHEENMGRFNPKFDLNLAYMPKMLRLIFDVFFTGE